MSSVVRRLATVALPLVLIVPACTDAGPSDPGERLAAAVERTLEDPFAYRITLSAPGADAGADAGSDAGSDTGSDADPTSDADTGSGVGPAPTGASPAEPLDAMDALLGALALEGVVADDAVTVEVVVPFAGPLLQIQRIGQRTFARAAAAATGLFDGAAGGDVAATGEAGGIPLEGWLEVVVPPSGAPTGSASPSGAAGLADAFTDVVAVDEADGQRRYDVAVRVRDLLARLTDGQGLAAGLAPALEDLLGTLPESVDGRVTTADDVVVGVRAALPAAGLAIGGAGSAAVVVTAEVDGEDVEVPTAPTDAVEVPAADLAALLGDLLTGLAGLSDQPDPAG